MRLCEAGLLSLQFSKPILTFLKTPLPCINIIAEVITLSLCSMTCSSLHSRLLKKLFSTFK